MSLRPVLRAAAIVNGQVEACFDKTLSSGSATAGRFDLGGYRAGNLASDVAGTATAAVDPTNTNCVILTLGAGVDPSEYTVLEVAPGAVEANATALGNVADSVGLTGSDSHSGTIGVTTAPNLVGIVPPDGPHITTNTLTYVFDKDVNGTPAPDATLFFFVDGAGNVCDGTGTGVPSGSTVTVAFPGCGSVAGAVRAGVFSGATTSASDPGSSSVSQSAVLPNAPNGGATVKPDLVSTMLGSDGDSITFTFDKNVVVPLDGGTGYIAELANGTEVPSTSAVSTGGNTVVARYGGHLAVNAEFGVIGFVDAGAAQAADNQTATGLNVPGSGGIGDNAGAFARAFTTAPDVFGITIAKAAGTITVNLDDRVRAIDTSAVVLYDAAGDAVGATPLAPSFNSTAGPGPETVTLAYPPSALTNVTSVQFLAGAFTTNGLSGADATSIDQLVGPISDAVVLKGFKAVHVKSHKKATHRKHTRKHAAKR